MQPPDTKMALDALVSAMADYSRDQSAAQSSSRELDALAADNESLRSELSALQADSTRQVSQLQRSLDKMTTEHEEGVLRDMKYIAELERRCEDYQAKEREGKIELGSLRAQMSQMDKFPEKIAQLQSQLLDTDDRRVALEGRVAECTAEIDALNKLVQSLKDKMKAMSGSGERRDFADTFEEVMREEMMAMKVAFESKLKIAREEADAASRRHQLEIKKAHGSPLGIVL